MVFPDLRQIDQAWQQCRRRKRATTHAQFYEQRLLDNLIDTAQALNAGNWRPARPVCFIVTRPKGREIHAAAYRDRVVHHWLVPRLEALYEPVFIHDAYSNRQGKGTHAAVRRLQSFMHSLQSRHGAASPGYFLQLDVANFFVSLDRPLLFSLLQKRLGKAVRQGRIPLREACKLRWLCHRVLKQEVGREARVLSSSRETQCVPPHKRLLNAPENKGLPIGNLTSQHFANVYLNELDQFVKHKLKCRYYLRYVDDMVLLHHDPEQLRQWHQEIAAFLRERLMLELRPDALLAPAGRGVDFLGYIVRPHYRLVRRRVIGNLHERLRTFEKAHIMGQMQQHGACLRIALETFEALRSCLASYLGHFRHANSHRLILSLWEKWPWLGLFLDYALKQEQLIPLWQPRQVGGYRSQVRFFRKLFPCAHVVVQRGCEMDAFPPWGDGHRLASALPAIRKEVRQLNVVEAGYLKGGLKRRVIDTFYLNSGVTLCRN
ncbi:reverse transcriptase domain-containing protein [Thiolapillus sp.]